MMKRILATLGYSAAALTILAALLTPFVLMQWFMNGVVALGLHTDTVYSGGDVAYAIPRSGYRITVNHPVVPEAPLTGATPFVQLAWEPANGLPARIEDDVDVDGDGRADLRACFNVPRDPAARLQADVTSLSPRIASVRGVARQSFALAIVRVGDRIVLRVPLTGGTRATGS